MQPIEELTVVVPAGIAKVRRSGRSDAELADDRVVVPDLSHELVVIDGCPVAVCVELYVYQVARQPTNGVGRHDLQRSPCLDGVVVHAETAGNARDEDILFAGTQSESRCMFAQPLPRGVAFTVRRSEEHTSELQS